MVMNKVYGDHYKKGSITIKGKKYTAVDFDTDKDKARKIAAIYRNKITSVRVVTTRDGYFVVRSINNESL